MAILLQIQHDNRADSLTIAIPKLKVETSERYAGGTGIAHRIPAVLAAHRLSTASKVAVNATTR
jgi:hypothetical protein